MKPSLLGREWAWRIDTTRRVTGFRRRAAVVVLHVVLSAVALLMLAPYLWALSASVKSRTEVFSTVPQWWPSAWQWQKRP